MALVAPTEELSISEVRFCVLWRRAHLRCAPVALATGGLAVPLPATNELQSQSPFASTPVHPRPWTRRSPWIPTSIAPCTLSVPKVIFATVRINSAPERPEKSKLRPGPWRDLGRGLDVSGAGVDRSTAPSCWWPDVVWTSVRCPPTITNASEGTSHIVHPAAIDPAPRILLAPSLLKG